MMKRDKSLILYIDDDSSNLLLVKKILLASGFNYIEADSGIHGIDSAIKNLPDLILMDMNMPGLDGYEATTRLKSMDQFSEVPIVAITANVSEGDRERSLIAGCSGYMKKPIEIDTFVESIDSYLAGETDKVLAENETTYLKAYNIKIVERLEEKTRELESRLDEALKVSQMKSEFLSTMSHELRTPLNAIINYSEQQERNNNDNSCADYRDWMKVINENGKSLLYVVTEMMDLSLLQAGKVKIDMQPVVINDVITSIENKYSSPAESKNIKLTSCIDQNIGIINSDPGSLLKILDRLVDNAIKFTPQGEVTIECRRINSDDDLIPNKIKLSLPNQPGYILLSISDTGIGISETEIDNLFQDFHQIDGGLSRKYGGVGLGLGIVKRLVDLFGGFIWLKSEADTGSVFYVLLPDNIAN